MDYLETYDFYATSKDNAEKKMEAVNQETLLEILKDA